MKPKQETWQRLLLLTLLIAGLYACGTGEEYPPPPQTEILSVDFIPNENLSPGDTVAIRCRIKDSLDTRFNFYWHVGVAEDLGATIGGGNLIDAEYMGYYAWDKTWNSEKRNTVHWIVPDCTRSFTLIVSVLIDNGNSEKLTVLGGNSIKITIN